MKFLWIDKRIEQYGPYLLAVCAAGGMYAIGLDISTFPESLPVGSMTFGVVVAGFTATQRNIFLGMGGSKVMKFAMVTGYYQDVLRYFRDCIYSGLFLALWSVLLSLICGHIWVWMVWGGMLVLVLAFIVRSELLMSVIIQRFIEGQRST